MALYFYEHEKEKGYANLGDDLNPYLFDFILDRNIITSKDVVVIGIGTILNDLNEKNVRSFKKKIVFSSGCGYGNYIPNFDHSWAFSAVRGHLSRQALGLPRDIPVGDGAILLPKYLPHLSTDGAGDIVFMPHIEYHMHDRNVWMRICMLAGLRYIDPSAPRNTLLSILANAKLVITSAMHGAIIADALRTPWLAVNTSGVNTEKWRDWASALDFEVLFHDLPYRPPVEKKFLGQRLLRQQAMFRAAKQLSDLKRFQGHLSSGHALREVQTSLMAAADKLNALTA